MLGKARKQPALGRNSAIPHLLLPQTGHCGFAGSHVGHSS